LGAAWLTSTKAFAQVEQNAKIHLPQFSDQEEMEMERLKPKGPGEMQKQMEEDQFLRSGKTPTPRTANPRDKIVHWNLRSSTHDGDDDGSHAVRECGHTPDCESKRHLS